MNDTIFGSSDSVVALKLSSVMCAPLLNQGVVMGALYVGNDMYRDIHGAREAGMQTVMFDSDQGTKAHLDCVPDHTITDFRDLLQILDLP